MADNQSSKNDTEQKSDNNTQAESGNNDAQNDSPSTADPTAGGGATSTEDNTKTDTQPPTTNPATSGEATNVEGDNTNTDTPPPTTNPTASGETTNVEGGNTNTDTPPPTTNPTASEETTNVEGGNTNTDGPPTTTNPTADGGATSAEGNTSIDSPPTTTNPVPSEETTGTEENNTKTDTLSPTTNLTASGGTTNVEEDDAKDGSKGSPDYVNQPGSNDTEEGVPNQSPGSNSNTGDYLLSSVEPKTDSTQNNPPVVNKENETNSNTNNELTPEKGIETLVATSVQPNSVEEDNLKSSVEPKSSATQKASPVANGENETNSDTNIGATSGQGIDAIINRDLEDPDEETTLLPPEQNLKQVGVLSEDPVESSGPTTTGSKPPKTKKPDSENVTGAQELKLVAVVAGIVVIVSLVQVIIGSLYKNNCPVNPYIPIYLIVAGISGLLLPVFLLGLRFVNKKHKENPDIGYFFEYALFLIYLGWLLIGCVLVFNLHVPVQFVNPANTYTYCLNTVYYTALATIIVTGIFMVVFLIISWRIKTSKPAGSTSKKPSA